MVIELLADVLMDDVSVSGRVKDSLPVRVAEMEAEGVNVKVSELESDADVDKERMEKDLELEREPDIVTEKLVELEPLKEKESVEDGVNPVAVVLCVGDTDRVTVLVELKVGLAEEVQEKESERVPVKVEVTVFVRDRLPESDALLLPVSEVVVETENDVDRVAEAETEAVADEVVDAEEESLGVVVPVRESDSVIAVRDRVTVAVRDIDPLSVIVSVMGNEEVALKVRLLVEL